MPTYEYLHRIETCNETWEDWRSIVNCVPKNGNIVCPKCGGTENIELLVSGGSGKGTVELSGAEYKAKLVSDAAEYKKHVYSNEAAYANIIGPDKYQTIQTQMDKYRR
jgi:hypothetical protein